MFLLFSYLTAYCICTCLNKQQYTCQLSHCAPPEPEGKCNETYPEWLVSSCSLLRPAAAIGPADSAIAGGVLGIDTPRNGNATLAGVESAQLNRPQSVINAAARGSYMCSTEVRSHQTAAACRLWSALATNADHRRSSSSSPPSSSSVACSAIPYTRTVPCVCRQTIATSTSFCASTWSWTFHQLVA